MNKVVVFGGSGFLGSYVADELADRNYEVVIADQKEPPYLTEGQVFHCCDILDSTSLEGMIKEASVIYNFAGLADIDKSIRQPKMALEQNVIGNINILEACRGQKIARYVYASSAYAFSVKGSFYGISKFASEQIVQEYAKRDDLSFTIIRYGSLYGERADQTNGVYRMLREALETGAIQHRGDGEEVREYIHAIDAARLSVDVIEDDQFINQHTILTGVERMRQRDLLLMVQEILNGDVDISFTNKPREGHYDVTPYSYRPNLARKLVSNSFIDLGQGLVSCLQSIQDEISNNT